MTTPPTNYIPPPTRPTSWYTNLLQNRAQSFNDNLKAMKFDYDGVVYNLLNSFSPGNFGVSNWLKNSTLSNSVYWTLRKATPNTQFHIEKSINNSGFVLSNILFSGVTHANSNQIESACDHQQGTIPNTTPIALHSFSPEELPSNNLTALDSSPSALSKESDFSQSEFSDEVSLPLPPNFAEQLAPEISENPRLLKALNKMKHAALDRIDLLGQEEAYEDLSHGDILKKISKGPTELTLSELKGVLSDLKTSAPFKDSTLSGKYARRHAMYNNGYNAYLSYVQQYGLDEDQAIIRLGNLLFENITIVKSHKGFLGKSVQVLKGLLVPPGYSLFKNHVITIYDARKQIVEKFPRSPQQVAQISKNFAKGGYNKVHAIWNSGNFAQAFFIPIAATPILSKVNAFEVTENDRSSWAYRAGASTPGFVLDCALWELGFKIIGPLGRVAQAAFATRMGARTFRLGNYLRNTTLGKSFFKNTLNPSYAFAENALQKPTAAGLWGKGTQLLGKLKQGAFEITQLAKKKLPPSEGFFSGALSSTKSFFSKKGSEGFQLGKSLKSKVVEYTPSSYYFTDSISALQKAVKTGEVRATTKGYLDLARRKEAFDASNAALKILKQQKGRGPMSRPDAIRMLKDAGFEILKKPKGIPNNYLVKVSKDNGGLVYYHPTSEHISIRVMPGNPHGLPTQKVPYVIQKDRYHFYDKFGKSIDKKGKKYTKKSEEIHIPLSEYIYRN